LKTGSVTQAYDAGLLSLAGLTYASDSFIKVTATDTYAIRTLSEVRTDLGLVIGTDIQAHGDVLDDLNTLGAPASDGQFIVATGAGVFAYESTTTARTSLGVGTGDSPAFAAVSLGTGELTCGSINRTTGTLTLEVGGTAEVSITSTTVTLGGNLIIPNSGTIGSVGDTDVMTIDASGNCTFSVFPITPSAAPDADYEVANKKYVDDNAGGGFSSRVSAYLGSDQTITKNTWTIVELDTESYDGDGEFASYTFTATTAGYYHITGRVCFLSMAAGKAVYVAIHRLNLGINVATNANYSTTAGTNRLEVSCDVYLNGSTDTIVLRCYHDDTVNRDISGDISNTNMHIHRFA